MKTPMLIILLLFAGLNTMVAQEKINWMSLEEALTKAKKEPRKIFIDMYTDWCKWCTEMDRNTFSNPVIAAYMNKNYYAVKFDAEGQKDAQFNNKTFKQPKPGQKRSAHELAIFLLNGRLSYPSYVFVNPDQSVITAVPGYYPPADFEPVLHFFATEAWKKTNWTDYQKSFKGKVTK
jgi:thioredoxin-related protein